MNDAGSNRSNERRRHSRTRSWLARGSAVVMGTGICSIATIAVAGPEGGEIVSGVGSIGQVDPVTTLITQGSDRLGIDWDSFNVAADERVVFDQPSTTAVALNRIFDQNPSQIFGALDANGHVYLINPNGMVFGESAQINVAALVASSLDISIDDFMSGNYEFAESGGAGGLVVNRGLIQAATGGSVTLLGGAVANEGLIVADLGQVTLGAGSRARLDFTGDGLLFFEIDAAVLENESGAAAAVSNSGTIAADGGEILLTGSAAREVFSSVVNNDGVLRATSIDDTGGVIRLLGDGGNVVSRGAIEATGVGGSGGSVTLTGDRVGLYDGASVDVSGELGGGSIAIGGGLRGSGDTAEFTQVGSGVSLNADALQSGDGGEIVVFAEDTAWFLGEASARGGAESGDGGFVEISGREGLVFAGDVDTSAPNGALGTLLFDPTDINIIDGAGGLDDGALPDLSNTTVGAGLFQISEQGLEALAANSQIVLEATNNVVMNDLTDNTLGLALTAGGGSLTISADTDLDGSGAFVMDAGDTILTEGGVVDISGSTLMIGSIDTTGAGDDNSNGAITLSSTGNTTVSGDLRARGTTGGAGGTVTVSIDTDDSGVDTLTLGGAVVADTASLNGSATADDTLEGNDGAVDAFVLNAANAGTLNGTAFTNFSTVSGLGGADTFTFDTADFTGTAQGGADNDVFQIDDGGGFGSIDGGTETDLVSYANRTAAVTVAAGVFTGIEQLDGSANADVLQGTALGDTFATTGVAAGTVAGIAYTSFERLEGLGGGDTFTLDHDVTGGVAGGADNDIFTINVSQSGQLLGGAGDDSFTVADGVALGFAGTAIDGEGDTTGDTLTLNNVGAINVTLAASDADGFSGADAGATIFTAGGFDGIDSVTIGADTGDDTLTGRNVASTWTQATVNDGTATLAFAGFALAAGNAAADTLQGGAGADAFSVTAADRISLNGAQLFSGIDTLQGLGGADVFTFGNDYGAGLDVDGGAGGDTFTVTAAQPGTVNLAGGDDGDTFNLGADNVGTVNGDGGVDVFNLNAGLTAGGVGVDGGAGNDIFNVNVTQGETVSGGADDDRFVVDVTQAGSDLDGGAGTNTVAVANGAGLLNIDGLAANSGSVNGNTVSNMQIWEGSDAAADVFNLAQSLTGVGSGAFGLGGNDTFNITATNVSVAVNGGTGGGDTLVGLAGAATTFDVTGANSGSVANGTGTITFATTENLTGGNLGDTFTLNGGSISGAADGAGGTDTLVGGNVVNSFSITGANSGTATGVGSFQNVENLTGNTQADTFTLAGGTLSGAVNGAAGSDTLVADNVVNAFGVTGANSGTATGVGSFQNIENLTGNAQADTFTLAGGTLAGAVNGAGGSDTLLGDNVANAFGVTGANSGSATGVGSFQNVESLTGNAQADTFTLAGGTLAGLVNGAGGSDTLVGDNVASTFNVTGTNSGTATGVGAFQNIENLTGNAQADSFTLAGGTLAGAVNGAAGNDTLVGDNVASAFTVTGANSGTATGVGSFQNVENLTGNGQADTFTFAAALAGAASGAGGDDLFEVNDGGSAGSIDGGTETDSVSYANRTAAVTVAADAFTAIEQIDGSANADVLQGTALADTFATSGAGAGTVGGIAYTSFERLEGLGGDDSFTLGHNVPGGVDGGAGNDVFNVNFAVASTVAGGADNDIFNVNAAMVPGATLDGNAGTNTVAVVNGAGTLNLNGAVANSGTVNGNTVSNMQIWQGSDTAADVFNLGQSLTGAGSGAFGRGGNDTFNITASNVTVAVDGGAGTDTLMSLPGTATTFNITGTNAGSVPNGTGTITFAETENLTGGTAADTFALGVNGVLAGTANGGAGVDQLVGANQANVFNIAGANAGSVTGVTSSITAFSNIENLVGNASADQFVVAAAGSLTGTVDGAGGADTLNLSALGARTVALSGSEANGFAGNEGAITGGFVRIDSIVGSSTAGDVLNGLASNSTWVLGPASGNTYSPGGATLTFSGFETLNGGAGVDSYTFGTGTVAGNLTLNGAGGTDASQLNGQFTLTGNLTLDAIESVAGSAVAANFLAANGLTISGATGGVGQSAQPLVANVATLSIATSGTGVFVRDNTPGLTITGIDIAGGDITVELDAAARGNMSLGLVNTGSGAVADSGNAPVDGGEITLTVANGDITKAPGSNVNVRGGGDATLVALQGNIGSVNDDIKIVIPDTSTLFLTGNNAYIDNVSLAFVDSTKIIDVVSNSSLNAALAASAASASSALLDVSSIDWGALDPDIIIFDVRGDGVLLPEDQRTDDASLIRPSTLALIRTSTGWKLIPAVLNRELVSALR